MAATRRELSQAIASLKLAVFGIKENEPSSSGEMMLHRHMHGLATRATKAAAATCLIVQSALPALAQTKDLPLIRDAEIEGLMRIYSQPIFEAAGINEGAAKVYLVRQPNINAFVAEGQRIFIHTGLLQQAKTPNEVIGVLAHETGHIAGGHLSRMNNELGKASNMAIASALLGAAAMVGAAVTGNSSAAQGGQALMMGGQSMAQRSVLAYARAQEASADQAAANFLGRPASREGHARPVPDARQSVLASTRIVSPYVMTHPMPLERIRNLEQIVKSSPYFGRTDPPALVLRHQLMQAKLFGFLNSRPGGLSEISGERPLVPARYARAIAAFRIGDLQMRCRKSIH